MERTRDEAQARTLEYYEHNAESYFRATRDADLSEIYKRFVRRVPKGGRILDAGSGSGRDTLSFVRCGYSVSAFDASAALCQLSTQLTGIRTSVSRFQDLEDEEKFDGIWACASLLHVPLLELPDAINRLVRALRCGAVLYMSFKHGTGERVTQDGRFFVDMTEERIRRILGPVPDLKVEEVWRTSGEGIFEGQDEWLNALVSKQDAGKSHVG